MMILLCNISWMRRYAGVTEDDVPRHGGTYVDEHGFGHEAINFKPYKGYVYGFIQLRTGTININRLGENDGNKIDDVLVVWRARSNIGSVVVGWYKDATVFNELQDHIEGREFNYENEIIRPQWIIKAKATNSFLVPPHERLFKVPVRQKGFGSQTFVSFLDSGLSQVKVFRKELLEYVKLAEKGIFKARRKGKRTPVDKVKKLRVERAAIENAIDYYVNRGYDVKSVEKDNVGYDLVASSGTSELLVEVKGTSIDSEGVTVNLSPNEYRTSNLRKKRYRICIIKDALGTPFVHEYIWNKESQLWEDENTGTSLSIAEVVSANMTIEK